MNCVLRCICEDDSEVYIVANKISEFEIETEHGSMDNDPIVEEVVIYGNSSFTYRCTAIEIFQYGVNVGEMDFSSNESWRKSEVFKVLMGCFK